MKAARRSSLIWNARENPYPVAAIVREWKQRRGFPQHEREHLQRLWAEGIASGPGRFENIAAIKAEARRRLLEEQPKIGG